MKNVLVFFIVSIAICFTSCDGKDRALNSTTQNVKESTLSKSFLESTEYFPKDYTESITDTILNNGYRIKIMFTSDMNKSLLRDFKIDTIHYKHYYREFNAKLTAFKNGTELLHKLIDKALLIELNPENKAFLNDAIMQYAGIDQEVSILENKAIIDIVFCKPETDDCLFYKLFIDSKGNYTVKLTDDVYYNES